MDLVLKGKVEALQTNLSNLRSASDVRFASSLCQQFWQKNGNISDKQIEWVGKLLDRATGAAPARTATQAQERPAAQAIGNPAGILQLFANARGHLRFPAIVLLTNTSGDVSTANMMRLTVAGAQAREPGTINVTSFDHDKPGRNPGERDERTWYGRISLDGTFTPGGISPELATRLVTILRLFAQDPARVAAEHGRLTGRCCFCRLALSDERSTAMGYGPHCAAHFGLPWGERPSQFACTPGAATDAAPF